MTRVLILLLLLFQVGSSATAQMWPDKPVKIIVPYAAGGGTDIIARVLADRLGESLGQRFIVENRAGASGNIGTDAVVRSAPDGYTLLVSATDIAVNPSTFKALNFNAVKDLAPITLLAWTPLIVAVHPDLKVGTPQELLALLKAKAGQFNYSSPGLGSGHHLAGEYLKKLAGVEMQHVAYRGAAPAIQDAVAGQVPITISGMPPVVELIKSGKLVSIAVTSAKRSKIFPDTPALAELGPSYKDIDVTNWFGFFAPAGVPDAIRNRLHEAAVKALSDPTVRRRVAEQGADAVGNSPEDFAAFLAAETDKYRRMAEATGVRAGQ
jgi:tripartite-type tricarboxylate transporter receptor subunit TctC